MAKPWYRKRPKHFPEAIQRALASDDARRRNLAWIVLEEVGIERGLQERFAERTGWYKGRLNHYLNGKRKINADVVQELAEILRRPVSEFEKPEHPLGIAARGGEPIEPGDPNWEHAWTFLQTLSDKGIKTVEELRAEFPFYFPPE